MSDSQTVEFLSKQGLYLSLKNPYNKHQSETLSPQIKHEFFRISSFCCFSLLRSANVSMMTPKIRLRTMIMTMKKKRRS